MLRHIHIIFCLLLLIIHLQCGAQEVISKSSHKNTLVVRLTCNDTLQMSKTQGLRYVSGGVHNPTGKWAEFSGDSLTLPIDMIEEMSIIKGEEVLRSQFTLGDSIGILGENVQNWFVDSIFPRYSSAYNKEELKGFSFFDYYNSKTNDRELIFSPCQMVFMDDPDDTNGLKSWGEFQGYNRECAWGALDFHDTICYNCETINNWIFWDYKYIGMGEDIAHTQYDYFANIAVDQAKQHGVEISYADSPIWMASKADVEYLLKHCGRDIMWERNNEDTYRTNHLTDLSKRNPKTYIRLYNPNDYCFYISSREDEELFNGGGGNYSTYDNNFYDPLTKIATVNPRTLKECPQSITSENTFCVRKRSARYACLWTSTLAPEGDDNSKAWALQITPEGCCLIKLDRSVRLPALMVGRPIDSNVMSTRKNINLKY